jgi:hypothetical protein
VLDGLPPANNEPILVVTTPGERYRYSGGGFVVMQLLMEEISEKPFAQLMRERVLDPLGMSNSTFEQQLSEARLKQVASAHEINGEPVDGRFHIYPEMAAAGLWSTPSDLARFILAVQRNLDGEGEMLLSQDMTRQMLTPQIKNRGLGFGLMGMQLATAIRERGSNKGFCAQWFAHTRGDGIVIMTNGAAGCTLSREIVMGAAQVYGWNEITQRTKKLFEASEELLASYAGRYQISDPLEAAVFVETMDKGLRIEVTGLARKTEYYPSREKMFFNRSGESVKFEVDEDGKVTALLFGRTRAERVD